MEVWKNGSESKVSPEPEFEPLAGHGGVHCNPSAQRRTQEDVKNLLPTNLTKSVSSRFSERALFKNKVKKH